MYSTKFSSVLRDHIWPYWRTYVIILVPLFLMPLPLALDAMVFFLQAEAKAGYAVLVVAIFWMTEALPLPVTSLLPIIMLPLMGIMSTAQVCAAYMRETTMLFIGGLVLALAIEKSCLHKRIALRVLLLVGASPRWLMLGIMVTTMFLSMWVSNTATVTMMVPIVEAVVEQLFTEDGHSSSMRRDVAYSNSNLELSVSDTTSYNEREGSIGFRDSRQDLVSSTVSLPADQRSSSSQTSLRKTEKIQIAMFMSVAYSVKIGGTGSLIGSSPQLAFKAIFQELYGSDTGVNFATWMLFNVPGMVINTFLAWIWLQYLFVGFRNSQDEEEKLRKKDAERIIRQNYEDLGPMSFEETSVLTLFVILVFLWIFRHPQIVPGWADLLPSADIGDSAAAIAVVIIIFTIPSKCKKGRGSDEYTALLEWDYIQEHFPGGLVLLLGSGFALSEASKISGLSAWLGDQLSGLKVLPPVAIVFVICFLTASITEVASYNATANILLPILAQMAESIQVNPIYLMVPAAVTCSYAFMLPVAAPSNALVFAAAKMKPMDMIKAGFVMNVICVVVICALMETIGGVIFDAHHFPAWAHSRILSEISDVSQLPPLCEGLSD